MTYGRTILKSFFILKSFSRSKTPRSPSKMSTTAKRVRLDTEKAQGGKEVEQQQDVEVKAVAGSAGTAGFSLREAIEKRTSVRAFTPQLVERNVLDSLLEAAVRAPTALQDECCEYLTRSCSLTVRSQNSLPPPTTHLQGPSSWFKTRPS